jgi:hypothetical protein
MKAFLFGVVVGWVVFQLIAGPSVLVIEDRNQLNS